MFVVDCRLLLIEGSEASLRLLISLSFGLKAISLSVLEIKNFN